MKLNKQSRLANFVFCLLLLAVVSWVFWDEFDRSWKYYQNTFNKMDAEFTALQLADLQGMPESPESMKQIELLAKSQKTIAARTAKINQLWLTDFGVTDRCMTCHQGVEKTSFAKAPQPYSKHPGKYLDPERHSVDKFGCTICHDGEGVALTVEEAHGYDHNWLKPLREKHFSQSSCATCHPMAIDIPVAAEMEDAPIYSLGRKLYLENNCLGCHLLKRYDRPERIGPILSKISLKSSQSWLKYWIKKPKDYLPQTTMPNFGLMDDEVEAIAAYLLDLEPVSPGTSGAQKVNSESIENGRKTIADLGCLGCHTINKKGGNFGPDLSRIGEKASASWVTAWIKDPKAYWSQTAMPKLRATDQEIDNITAYLMTLKGPDPIKTEVVQTKTSSELLNKGRLLVKDKGCTGCHAIGQFDLGFNAPNHLTESTEIPQSSASIVGIPLGYNAPEHNGIGSKRVDELVFSNTDIPHTLSDWLHTKVKTPRTFNTKEIPTLMPEFGFTDQEATALVTFLLSQSGRTVPKEYIKLLTDPESVSVKGEYLIEKYNCLGCHQIGQQGGVIGPDLSFEGQRVNPAWLTEFLQAPNKIRPEEILPTRMPTFGLSSAEAEAIAAYFADRNSTTYPYYTNIAKDLSLKDRDEAWRLYWQLFSCHTCHSWNDQGGKIGPDQSDMSGRLRKEWIAVWVKDPQKIIPDVQMPNFELYDDEAELLTELLMSFKDIPPAVWDQTRRRWMDEQLEKRAAEMGGSE